LHITVVIGDVDTKGADALVAEIKSAGGEAIAQQCYVTSWEEQLSLFQLAMKTYGHIDIVVPNAGLTESGSFTSVRLQARNGIPTKPSLKTFQVNLIGVLYSARLALYYLLADYKPGMLKSLIFVGSMASMEAIPAAPLYTTSKHAVLGLMASLYREFQDRIRLGVVCPWFADTAIVPTAVKLFMAGLPLTPIDRIGGAIFKAATDQDPVSNGGVYILPDEGDVFRIDRADFQLNKGVYKLINDRVDVLRSADRRGQYIIAVLKDIMKILGSKLLWLSLSAVVGFLAWKKSGEFIKTLFQQSGIRLPGSS